MQCINEKEESKFGETCRLGHKWCAEEKCPDYKPRPEQQQDA